MDMDSAASLSGAAAAQQWTLLSSQLTGTRRAVGHLVAGAPADLSFAPKERAESPVGRLDDEILPDQDRRIRKTVQYRDQLGWRRFV
jgi:hypothetical protein